MPRVRVAFVLLATVLLLTSVTPRAFAASRTLTFEDRVAAQEAIERVCWEATVATPEDVCSPPSGMNIWVRDREPDALCADLGVRVDWSSQATDWGDPSGTGARTYDVLRNGIPIALGVPYSSDTYSTYIDTSGINNVTYYYAVRYNNSCGLSATTQAVPMADNYQVYAGPSSPSPANDATVCLVSVLSWTRPLYGNWYRVQIDDAPWEDVSGTTSFAVDPPITQGAHTWDLYVLGNCGLIGHERWRFSIFESPDTDGDGVRDCQDNCPTEVNGSQTDTDADKVGDVCDNCPAAFNPGQEDTDSDGEGNLCDLDDGILYFTDMGPDYQVWQAELVYGSFNLYRGDLAVLRSSGEYTQDLSNPNADRFCGLADYFYGDAFTPPARKVVFYLVTGMAAAESSLGTNSAGVERPNDWPCP